MRYSENEDPIKFDMLALRYLKNKYAQILHLTYELISNCRFLPYSDIDKYKSIIDRHLFYPLSICSLYNIDPHDLINLWFAYACTRIIPSYLVNDKMDKLFINMDSKPNTISLFQLIFEVSYVFHNNVLFYSSDMFTRRFYPHFLRGFSRVISYVYLDISSRFSYDSYYMPDNILGDKSPLLRSNLVDIFAGGLLEYTDYSDKSYNYMLWGRYFDYIRQLLDDMADVKQDLISGRITYVVHLALSNSYYKHDLQNLIAKLWSFKTQHEYIDRGGFIEPTWEAIRDILLASNSYKDTVVLVHQLLDVVEYMISSGNYPGTSHDLLLLLDLKRAYLYRLIHLNFDDIRPVYIYD